MNLRILNLVLDDSFSAIHAVTVYLYHFFNSINKKSCNCGLQRDPAICIAESLHLPLWKLIGCPSFGVLFNGSWTFRLFHLTLWKKQILAWLCIFLAFTFGICFMQMSIWEAEKASQAVPRGAEQSCLSHGRCP